MSVMAKRAPDGKLVWPENAIAALLESLASFGSLERRGKWQLMANHVYNKTGVAVSAKQVGSKLGSLWAAHPQLMRAHMFPATRPVLIAPREGRADMGLGYVNSCGYWVARPEPTMSSGTTATRGVARNEPRVANRPGGGPRSLSLRPVFSWSSDGHIESDDEGERTDSSPSPPPERKVDPERRELYRSHVYSPAYAQTSREELHDPKSRRKNSRDNALQGGARPWSLTKSGEIYIRK